METQKKVTTETVPVVHSSQSLAPADMLMKAIDSGANIDTIERLVALQERWQQSQSKTEFVRSMAAFQSEMPTVKKLKQNGGTRSNYSPLEDIMAVAKPVLQKHGFMLSWNTSTTDKKIKVTCTATHINGHSETSEMTSDIASGTAANNDPQKAAITITYLKRYTSCSLLNIQVADEDQDARLEKTKPKLPASPKMKIMALLKALGEDTETADTCKAAVKKITKLELVENNFEDIITFLSATLEEQNANN